MSQLRRETPEQLEERLRRAREKRVGGSFRALGGPPGLEDFVPFWMRLVFVLFALGVGLALAWARGEL